MVPYLNFKPNVIRVGSILRQTFIDMLEHKNIALIILAAMGVFSSHFALTGIRHSKKIFEKSINSTITIKSNIPDINLDTGMLILVLSAIGLLCLINIIWSECVYEGTSNDKGGPFSFVSKMFKTIWTCLAIGLLMLSAFIASGVAFVVISVLIGIISPTLASVVPIDIMSIIVTILLSIAAIGILFLLSIVPFRLFIMFSAIAVGNQLTVSEAWRCTQQNSNKIVSVHSAFFFIIMPLSMILGYFLFTDDVTYLMSNIVPALSMDDTYEIQSILEEVFLDYEPTAFDLFVYSFPNTLWILLTVGANTHIYEELYPALEMKSTALDVAKDPTLNMRFASVPAQTAPPADTPDGHYIPFAGHENEISPTDAVGTSSSSGDHSKKLV